ncbi:TlpA family protein disulfide reductase [Paenibacillus xanthanilyticus]|uniref:TlpA family protein disulfide reductase n=1 Tax=Paenibacillus xanthanilyticus TaxID=1783531 RepID=A0ABV8K0K0_9BACL
MRRTLLLLAVILVLTGAALYQNQSKGAAGNATAASSSSEAKPKPGYTAPALSLPNLDEQSVAIGGQSDKLTLLNFWASWCYPCELEAPDLQELSEKYADRMVLLGVNSTKLDKERQAREFVDQQKLTFPILMDREGTATDLYKINTFPTSLIIDQNGVVRERVQGVITKAEWEDKIEKWLN